MLCALLLPTCYHVRGGLVPSLLSCQPLIEAHEPSASVPLARLALSYPLRALALVLADMVRVGATRPVVVLHLVPDDARPIALAVALTMLVLTHIIELAVVEVDAEHVRYPVGFLARELEHGATLEEELTKLLIVSMPGLELLVRQMITVEKLGVDVLHE